MEAMPVIERQLFGVKYSCLRSLDETLITIVSSCLPQAHDFRYVVTPNADHIMRIMESPRLRDIYNGAWICVNDSRVVQLLLWACGVTLPTICGSDLTAALLQSQWISRQTIIVIGGDASISPWLKCRVGHDHVFHYNPPMGFFSCSETVESVIEFIRQHLPAIIFLAVGSPSQEIIAATCRHRGMKGGIALCIGAGLLMAAGIEKRAPPIMRFAGIEWLYRLIRDPRRLAGRYFRNLGIFRIIVREFLLSTSRAN